MNQQPNSPLHVNDRLNEILLDYLDDLAAGRSPDRDQLLAAYPELREELSSALADYENVERIASPLRQIAADPPHLSGSRVNLNPLPAQPRSPWRESADPELGQLGDFRLLREIGRGGMGVVYEAEQLSLQRLVALKVLPFAATLDTRQLQRFKNEAQAAAILHHTNIVPVHAVGTERGVHFYAMQLIEGDSLGTLIRQMQQRAGLQSPPSASQAATNASTAVFSGEAEKPRPLPAESPTRPNQPDRADSTQSFQQQLSTQHSTAKGEYHRAVTRLMLQAAEALYYAHGMGIIHRDIKPANLLLDARGNLWITDFGLAQFQSDMGLTRTGDILGTLRYMSPEQASGGQALLDPRTDVYSLGATFYELLTLRPIFSAQNMQLLLAEILNSEPRPLRQLDPRIPVELETIILKSVSKNPEERYSSAADFAGDLRRYLDHKPILAQPPTILDWTKKWIRRHPTALLAGCWLLLLLAIGSLVAAALINHEKDNTLIERNIAKAALQREQQRAQEAEARLSLAQRSVNELFQVSEEELSDRPGMELLRKRLLLSVLGYYQEFIEQRRDDPEAQAELQATKARVEKMLRELGILRDASQVLLLRQETVQNDLGLTATQKAEILSLIQQIEAEIQTGFFELVEKSHAQRREWLLEHVLKGQTQLRIILTADQRLRLSQIALQAEGPRAFRDPEVVAALQLSPAQREEIRTIDEEAFFRRFAEAPRDHQRPPPPPDAEQHQKLMASILAVLEPRQLTMWQSLTGPEFRGKIEHMGPPFVPPRGKKPPW
ncbi:MAG: protein kinase [Pirellulales bacterium]|nr:protein kinase [Pirellulales bacterium]